MSQLTIALDSFTLQVALHLLESNLENRPAISVGDSYIETTANGSLMLVEAHFEKWLNKQLDL